MGVKIIVDSTADINPSVKERFKVVPLTIHFGEEEYIDGVTITNHEFYEKLIESDVLPSTSQATPIVFSEAFKEVADAGDSAVVLTIASDFSGTYQSAMIAAADYPEKIFVVDTRTAAIGSGILAELALRHADEGMSAKEIAERLMEEREKVCLIALLDTLEYLQKGGRISKVEAFAGGLLSIKPVIAVKDGKIITLGKARGSKQGNNYLIKEIENAGGADFSKPVILGYTGLSDKLLEKYVKYSQALWADHTDELHSTVIGSVIGTHAGPGAIAVAFFRK